MRHWLPLSRSKKKVREKRTESYALIICNYPLFFNPSSFINIAKAQLFFVLPFSNVESIFMIEKNCNCRLQLKALLVVLKTFIISISDVIMSDEEASNEACKRPSSCNHSWKLFEFTRFMELVSTKKKQRKKNTE